MDQKKLYSFTIYEDKEKTIEEVSINEETKEETIVKKKVTEKSPIEIILKKPTRRQIEEADLEYSVEISRCIKKGILTKAMLAKKYSDTGGSLSEEESKRLMDLYKKVFDLQNEMVRIEASSKQEENKDKTDQMITEMTDTRKEIVDIESNYRSLFDHTADTKAQNRLLLWYILNLTFIKKEEDSKERPYFEGSSFEDKLDSYYKKEEDPPKEYGLISRKVSTLIAFWFFNQASSEEDFKKLDERIESGEF
jgi:hypothetical protein